MEKNHSPRFPANELTQLVRKSTDIRGDYDKRVEEWKKEIDIIREKEEEKKRKKAEIKRKEQLEIFYKNQKKIKEKERKLKQEKLALSKLGLNFDEKNQDLEEKVEEGDQESLPAIASPQFRDIVTNTIFNYFYF